MGFPHHRHDHNGGILSSLRHEHGHNGVVLSSPFHVCAVNGGVAKFSMPTFKGTYPMLVRLFVRSLY
jgi:hypothetical protein